LDAVEKGDDREAGNQLFEIGKTITKQSLDEMGQGDLKEFAGETLHEVRAFSEAYKAENKEAM